MKKFPIILTAGVCLAVVMGILVTDGKKNDPPLPAPLSTSVVSPTSDSKELMQSKVALNERLEGFCNAFYRRDYMQKPFYDGTAAKSSVAEYATSGFIKANGSSFSVGSAADIALARTHASLQVKIKSHDGEALDDNFTQVDVEVVLTFTKTDMNGTFVHDQTQRMFWSKDTQGVWRIEYLSDTD